jgi:hypothetical protein
MNLDLSFLYFILLSAVSMGQQTPPIFRMAVVAHPRFAFASIVVHEMLFHIPIQRLSRRGFFFHPRAFGIAQY